MEGCLLIKFLPCAATFGVVGKVRQVGREEDQEQNLDVFGNIRALHVRRKFEILQNSC